MSCGHGVKAAAQAVRLYRDGRSTWQVVDDFENRGLSVSPAWVRYHCLREGCLRNQKEAAQLRAARQGYRRLERRSLEMAVVDRMTQTEIAKRLGVAQSSVRRWLRTSDIEISRSEAQKRHRWLSNTQNARRRAEKQERASTMRENGLTWDQVAAELGVSTSTARRWVNRKEGPK